MLATYIDQICKFSSINRGLIIKSILFSSLVHLSLISFPPQIEILHHLYIILFKEQIIHIETNNDNAAMFFLHIQSGFTFYFSENYFSESMYRFLCTRLLELASARKELFLVYTPFFSSLNKKSLRLLNINLFIKFSIKKCRFNIKLKYLTFLLCSNNNYSSNCLKTSNWREIFIKINI